MTELTIELSSDSAQQSVRILIESHSLIDPVPQVMVVEIAEHGPNDVSWIATVPCILNRSKSALTWIGEINGMQGRERLWAIMRIYEQIEAEGGNEIPSVPTEERILDFAPALHLETAPDRAWSSGPSAEAEALLRTLVREARFGAPLLAEGATTKSQRYAALVIVENLLLSQPQAVPGIELVPLVKSTLGLDIAVTMNEVLPQLGYPPELVHHEKWLAEQSRVRPAGFIHMRTIHADSDHAMHLLVIETARQFLDLVALRRHAGARVVAGISLKLDEKGNWLGHTWSPLPGYGGNLAVGFISGEDPDSLMEQWAQLQRDPRAQLWLSMYRDCLEERVADYRFLRMFNLLEGIAKGIVASAMPLSDPSGAPLLQENGKPYTTDQARGALYNLFRQIADRGAENLQNFASPLYVEDSGTGFQQRAGDIWEELSVWVKLRNMVAHTGSVRTPKENVPDSQRGELERSLTNYGFDGSANSGFGSILTTISRDCETVLFAALSGRI